MYKLGLITIKTLIISPHSCESKCKKNHLLSLYLVKIGQIPSEIDVRTYARIKNLTWDQLLATKAEIIHTYAVF